MLQRLPDMPKWVVADRDCSGHTSCKHIRVLGATPAIPSKRNEALVACPNWTYVHCNQGERLSARLKDWRAVATRYEKQPAPL